MALFLSLEVRDDPATSLSRFPSQAKYANRAIDDDADSFVKNLCSSNKWMIIELSQVSQRHPGGEAPCGGGTLGGAPLLA
jgi:hypothetical protein